MAKTSIARNVAISLLPPILTEQIRGIKNGFIKRQSRLFDGNDKMFKEVLSSTSVYGEYGCGLSTVWVTQNTSCPVFSVDTSAYWIENTKKFINMPKRAQLHYVDAGEVGAWGRPKSFKNRSRFSEYTDWIWQQDEKPDTILIDGRFRVCCFLTILVKAQKGTKIIFDDYLEREQYHVAEDFVKKSDICGRQALFVVPEFSIEQITEARKELERFRYVMD